MPLYCNLDLEIIFMTNFILTGGKSMSKLKNKAAIYCQPIKAVSDPSPLYCSYQ